MDLQKNLTDDGKGTSLQKPCSRHAITCALLAVLWVIHAAVYKNIVFL